MPHGRRVWPTRLFSSHVVQHVLIDNDTVAADAEGVRVIPYSQARADLADIYDEALGHLPTRITRRRAEPAVLLSLEDFGRLVERFAFTPEVRFEASSVSIWLPELAIWGRGAAFADAQEDLMDEVDQLLALVVDDARLRSAPNMLQRLPWLYRLMLAEDGDQRRAILFSTPAASPA